MMKRNQTDFMKEGARAKAEEGVLRIATDMGGMAIEVKVVQAMTTGKEVYTEAEMSGSEMSADS
jgi:hypothetical protein